MWLSMHKMVYETRIQKTRIQENKNTRKQDFKNKNTRTQEYKKQENRFLKHTQKKAEYSLEGEFFTLERAGAKVMQHSSKHNQPTSTKSCS